MAQASSAPSPCESASMTSHEQMASDWARINRVLRTLSTGNRTLLRASDEQTLLRDMCELIVAAGGYRAACVAYAERDASKSLRWMVCVGTELESLQSLPFTWADEEWGISAMSTAIRTGKPIVGRSYQNDSDGTNAAYDVLRAHALEHGYAATTAFPLLVEGEVLGALTVAASDPDAFDEQEFSLLAELAEDLSYGIATLRARLRHQKAEETIKRMAYFDSLTGLPNRVQLVEKLQAAIDTAQQRSSSLAVLHLEVARVHEINKVLGYRAGDELMQALARRLAREVLRDEILARVGETEFALLLTKGCAAHAVQFAAHLGRALHEPVEVSDLMVDPRVGIGIAMFPEHATDADSLIRRANAAMHQAKPLRGGYAVYTGGQEKENTRRLALMGDLHRAIKNDELQLYCQPKIDLATGGVCSAEALMRWQHPEHGLLSTSEFIQLAEHAGTITPLTDWILEATCKQCHAWQKLGQSQRLAVNLSALDLYDPKLVDRIRDRFINWGIAPGLIQFELTESSLMTDPAGALETLYQLKKLDVELFVDDFGTGYSSLSYLQRLPVDGIKIDQSFVIPMETNKGSETIVSSTIELGHKLGLTVVAEGVESRPVWDRLVASGCDMAQGYLISRPMPACQFLEWKSGWDLRGAPL